MDPRRIEIRPLESVDECRGFQEVQRRIWVGDPADIVPIHVLVTQKKNGGMLLGAFSHDGPAETRRMVGIAFGWPGLDGKELKFCSHIVGVLPEWHGKKIGLQLKLAQRRRLLDDGLMKRVTWTYDPLQRVNGILNIHRLGATCSRYIPNLYGAMEDTLNAGMPTDRFEVDWIIDSPRVEHALSTQRADPPWSGSRSGNLLRVSTRAVVGSEVRAPVEQIPAVDGRPFALPLPAPLSELRKQGAKLVQAWRLFLREACQNAFEAGYYVVDCVSLDGAGPHYILVPKGDHPFGSHPWI